MEQLPSAPDVVLDHALPHRPGTWRGRAGHRAVDVTVVALPPGAAIRRAALASLTPLLAGGGGGLPRGRAATLCRDGVAFVADACDGAPLPRRLSGEQVRILGEPAARVLAALHRRGLTWGGSAAELLLDRDGLQLPYDGMVRRRVAGRLGSVAGDLTALVSALADRCEHPRLAELVAHPPPDAPALARALGGLDRPRPGRRGVLLGGAAISLAAGVGWWSVPAPRERPAAAALARARSWSGTVHRLDVARAAALAGDAPLTEADAAGSPADRLDAATRAALVRRHLTVAAPAPELARVVPLAVTAGTARLQVTDSLAGYEYRDPAGRVVGRVPARGRRTWTITLRWSAGGWRFASVS